MKFIPFGKTIDLTDALVENSPYKSTSKLKGRLYKEGVKTKQCEECGIIEWNNKEIIFHLDHVNGDSTDKRINNLKILCPNCHSQTPTYTGRNINKNKVE